MPEAGDRVKDIFYKDTCTIWNKHIDGIWETEIWFPTVVKNVRILVSRGNNIQSSGNSAADSVRLHIMDGTSKFDKLYMDYKDWARLTAAEKMEFATLTSENESFFTVGDSSKEVSTNNFFSVMKEKYNSYRISSVDRFEVIPHFEVWGK